MKFTSLLILGAILAWPQDDPFVKHSSQRNNLPYPAEIPVFGDCGRINVVDSRLREGRDNAHTHIR